MSDIDGGIRGSKEICKIVEKSIFKQYLNASVQKSDIVLFTKLEQDKISKIRNLLPVVPNPIKFGGVVHNNQHDISKNFL